MKVRNFYIINMTAKVVVKPLDMKVIKEEILFDAERDNEGKGVSVDEMIKMLKKIK